LKKLNWENLIKRLKQGVDGKIPHMKINQNKPSYPGKTGVKKAKENEQLQKSLELATFQLKKSKSKKDQLMAKFLANNYIHSETGLITSKVR